MARPAAPLPMEELAEKYRAGRPTSALALSYGVAKSTVNVRLRAHGVQLRNPGYPASRPAVIPKEEGADRG